MGRDIEKDLRIRTDVLCFLVVIVIFFFILFSYLIFKMYKKYKGKIKPGHIFLINLIITFILTFSFLIFNPLYPMLKLNTSVSFDFCPHYLFGLFLVVTINIDIIIMQIDRFVAVFWSLEYPAFATNGKAVLVCCVSKILPSAVSFTVLFLDTEYLKCADIFLLFFTRTTNMIFISCLNLSVTTFVGIVSSYLGFKMVKIKKTVNPIVNLQVMLPKTPATVPEMSDTNVTGRKICVKRIDDQPNMFYSIEMKETAVEGEESGVRNPTAEQ